MRGLLVFLTCCCSGPPPAKPTGQPPPAPSRRALDGYPSVLEPASADCTFTGTWGQDQPTALHLGEGGPVFATGFRTESAKLELAGSAAFVEIEVEGFRFWGHVDRPVLYPARAFVMAGYLLPGFHAQLHPIGARPHELTVELTPPAFVKPVAPPRDTRPCTDLSLEQGDVDPPSALGDIANSDSFKLPASTPIPLATAPGSAPVAELRFDADANVSVIEQSGDLARIVIDDQLDRKAGTYVVGWVTRALLVHTDGFGRDGSWSTGAGRPASSGLSRAKRHVQCAHEIPLIVEVGAARHLAGAVASGTKFGVSDDPGDTLAITLDRISLELAPDARVLVKRTAIADCTDVPR